jgi:hypothetical protein
MKPTGRVFLSLLVAFAAGCASHQEKIVFSDESKFHAAEIPPAVLPTEKKLERADELKIKNAVFSYLLERHFWDLGEYSAVFLQADDAQVAQFIKKYPAHDPPIKMGYHADLMPNQTPLDKDTGKPAMLLSVEVDDPAADDSVVALGKWYAGGAVSGFYTFFLKQTSDDWEIQTVK